MENHHNPHIPPTLTSPSIGNYFAYLCEAKTFRNGISPKLRPFGRRTPNKNQKLTPSQAPRPPTEAKRPTARSKALARLKDPLLPRKLHRPDNAVSDSFADSKRDKRQIRRSAFISRISKSAPRTGGNRTALKRRRPSKKLVATLESLGDALGEIERDELKDGDGEEAAQAGKTRHRSLRSRPGALKRKEKVVRGEMQRFSHNLAQLATMPSSNGGDGSTAEGKAAGGGKDEGTAEDMETETAGEAAEATPASSGSNRWAALRSFISATMEQNPAFVGKG